MKPNGSLSRAPHSQPEDDLDNVFSNDFISASAQASNSLPSWADRKQMSFVRPSVTVTYKTPDVVLTLRQHQEKRSRPNLWASSSVVDLHSASSSTGLRRFSFSVSSSLDISDVRRARLTSPSSSFDGYSNDNCDGSLFRRQESVIETIERRRRENISRKLRELRESAPSPPSSVPSGTSNTAAANSTVHTRRRRSQNVDDGETVTVGSNGINTAHVEVAKTKPRPIPISIPTIVPLHRVSSASVLQTAASMSSMRPRNSSTTNGSDAGGLLTPSASGPVRANWSIGVPGVTNTALAAGINDQNISISEQDRCRVRRAAAMQPSQPTWDRNTATSSSSVASNSIPSLNSHLVVERTPVGLRPGLWRAASVDTLFLTANTAGDVSSFACRKAFASVENSQQEVVLPPLIETMVANKECKSIDEKCTHTQNITPETDVDRKIQTNQPTEASKNDDSPKSFADEGKPMNFENVETFEGFGEMDTTTEFTDCQSQQTFKATLSMPRLSVQAGRHAAVRPLPSAAFATAAAADRSETICSDSDQTNHTVLSNYSENTNPIAFKEEQEKENVSFQQEVSSDKAMTTPPAEKEEASALSPSELNGGENDDEKQLLMQFDASEADKSLIPSPPPSSTNTVEEQLKSDGGINRLAASDRPSYQIPPEDFELGDDSTKRQESTVVSASVRPHEKEADAVGDEAEICPPSNSSLLASSNCETNGELAENSTTNDRLVASPDDDDDVSAENSSSFPDENNANEKRNLQQQLHMDVNCDLVTSEVQTAPRVLSSLQQQLDHVEMFDDDANGEDGEAEEVRQRQRRLKCITTENELSGPETAQHTLQQPQAEPHVNGKTLEQSPEVKQLDQISVSDSSVSVADENGNKLVKRAVLDRKLEDSAVNLANTKTLTELKEKYSIIDMMLTKDCVGVGFCIEGGSNFLGRRDPIKIKRMFRGDTWAKGSLQTGDELISINGRSLANMTHDDAWTFLKMIPDGRVHVTVRRQEAPSVERNSNDAFPQ